MSLVLLLLALAVVGVVAAVAAGRVTGGLEAPTTSRPHRPLPADDLVPPDVDAVRFSLGLRGYRMDEVDAVLDRLRDELAERDRRIAELTDRGEGPGGATEAAAGLEHEPAAQAKAQAHSGVQRPTPAPPPARATHPEESP